MKKLYIFIVAVLMLSLLVVPVLSGCGGVAPNAEVKVVTSTSLIASIVEQVGGERVEVVNIIPPAQCPGHFDVAPGDIQKLADADLFLLHGWQGEKFSGDLIASANNPDLTVVDINIEGNWMTPSVQTEAADFIAGILSQVDAENADLYQNSAGEYKSFVSLKEGELQARMDRTDLSKVNVICSDQQGDGFVQWTGLNIIATFGRPDSLTPQLVKELVDKGREEGVALIIDNMQSGADAGAGIAEELGCKRVILSNFPGGYENAQTWDETIDYNVELILKAVA
ncbi:metal ABC transporter substrate-binding protein [Chloroflexota bacterium]